MKTLRKIAILFICAAMIISTASICSNASGNPTINVSKATCYRSSTAQNVDITVSLENNPGVTMMLLNLSYSSDVLTLVKVTDAGILGSTVHGNNYAANPYVLCWANDTAETNYTVNGKIVTLTFEVAGNAALGEYPVRISYDNDNDEIMNSDMETVDFNVVNGSITVTETKKEDITGVEFDDKIYTYNGEEQSITVTGTLPAGANVEYTNNKATAAGTYDATAVITASGYNTLTLTAEMTIEQKAITVSGISAEDKVYDGTTAAVISGGTLSGVVSGDDVSAAVPEQGTFASASVGKNIVVTIGDVTLKGADAGNYTVTQPSALKATITATEIAIKADDIQMAKGTDVPTLTYTITSGQLYGDDTFSGSLTTKADGTKLGTFDITQGTLKATSNYKLTFTKGVLTVVDKTPQNISISGISEKTYGDDDFSVTVVADEAAQLSNYTYVSSDTSVATIDADGKITIIGTGETTISVTESGNEEYASTTVSEKLIVNKKSLEVSGVDYETQTATLEGAVEGDDVAIDFEKLILTLGDEIDDENVAVQITSFVLTGEDSGNYAVSTESVNSVLAKDNLVTVTVTKEHGTVTGEGNYIKGTDVTLKASADSGYKFSAWYDGDTKLSTSSSYTFTATKDLELAAKFSKKSSGGGGTSSSSYTVKFNSNGGSTVASQTVDRNEAAEIPDVPTKGGYTFEGWYTDPTFEKAYDFTSKVTSSFTLYAKWTEEPSTTIVLTIGEKKALVNDKTVENDVAPQIVNDRTMLPIRFIAENLGAEVVWNADEPEKVVIVKDDIEIIITINSDTAYVDGKKETLDSPAFLENDRTYIPIRFVAENLGAEVEWNNDTQEVTITAK